MVMPTQPPTATNEGNSFDLDWAIDAQRQRRASERADFIRILNRRTAAMRMDRGDIDGSVPHRESAPTSGLRRQPHRHHATTRPTAIGTTHAGNAAPAARYATDGTRARTPRRGINILRLCRRKRKEGGGEVIFTLKTCTTRKKRNFARTPFIINHKTFSSPTVMPQKTRTTDSTPMMRQFYSLKENTSRCSAALPLRRPPPRPTPPTRLAAARILGTTLTTAQQRQRQKDATEMRDSRHHALDTYLPKLIRAGRRAAICDQLEDPKLTKTLVKRGIHGTRHSWRGDGRQRAQLQGEQLPRAAVCFNQKKCGVAFLDISTGEFLTGEGSFDYIDKLLGTMQPRRCYTTVP